MSINDNLKNEPKEGTVELKKLKHRGHYRHEKECLVVDFLADKTQLSKIKIKEAMTQGSCFIRKKGEKKLSRQRKAKFKIEQGDYIEFYFDPELFERQKNPPTSNKTPRKILDKRSWSAWYKPAGWLSQGTIHGDAHALERYVSKTLNREVFVIGRLDRETMGVMIFAHTKVAAREMNRIFATPNKVKKEYEVWVKGLLEQQTGKIDKNLDEKAAITHYKVVKEEEGNSLLNVRLQAARLHQIRRHFCGLGHPVLGDSRYGRNCSHPDGLQLLAASIEFKLGKKLYHIQVPPSELFG